MKKQASAIDKSKVNIKHILVTDIRHDYLLKIFKDKCMGEVSLYTDELNNNNVDGKFLHNSKENKDYSWNWAHKIYYSYDRLTSMVGKKEFSGYFKNRGNEYIYIFEKLSKDDIYIIKNTTKENCIMFTVEDKNESAINDIANITHNFYAAWLRLHYLHINYNEYLNGAKEQLKHLKSHLSEFYSNKKLFESIDFFIENTESFKNDNGIRLELLKLFAKHIKVSDYSSC